MWSERANSVFIFYSLLTVFVSSLCPSVFTLSCPFFLFTSPPHLFLPFLNFTLKLHFIFFFNQQIFLLSLYICLFLSHYFVHPMVFSCLDAGLCRCPCAVGDGGGRARRDGVGARNLAPLAQNAMIDRRLEPTCFVSYSFL